MNRAAPTEVSAAADSLLGRLTDQYLEALDRGDEAQLARLTAAHPDLAAVIRATYPALLALRKDEQSLDAKAASERQIGDFRLLRELGRGGMGVVYEAVQLSLGRRVALKVLPLAGMLDDRRLRRFRNEAQAAAALEHPNIVPVYEVGCDRGVHYYAMQLIRGFSLGELLQRSRGVEFRAADGEGRTVPFAALSTASARPRERYDAIARIGIQAADALAYAHREGIVHRDVKPSNLLLDEQGRLWVSDFGLARVQTDNALTQTGDVVGTLRYMSPEQLGATRVVDGRTDVYSLGMTLYELIAGQPPFADAPREQLAVKALSEAPAPLRKIDPTAPVDLETIVLRATAKDCDARYESAAALADDLRRFVNCQPVLARRPTRWQHVRYWARRNPTLAATTALLLAAMAVLAIGGPTMAWRQRELAQQAAQRLFVADLNLAYDAWYRGHVDRVEDLLDKHATHPPHGDSRDFAFQHLIARRDAAADTVAFKREEAFEDVAIAPDGQTIAACGGSRSAMLFGGDLSGQPVTLESSAKGAVSLGYSPDGRQLVVGEQRGVRLWDTTTWQSRSLDIPAEGEVRSVQFAPDGSVFAAATSDGRLGVWDPAGTRRWLVTAHQAKIWKAAFSPDGKTLATVCNDHHIKLWDADRGTLVRDLARLHGAAFDVAWARNGDILIVAGAQGILFLDAHTGVQLRGLAYDVNPVASVAVRGDLLVTGGHDHLIQCWDIATGYPVGEFVASKAQVYGLAFTPDGDELVACGGDGTLRRFELRAVFQLQEKLSRIDFESPAAVAITADGATCVSVSAPM